jgi:branched-chain amino acid transport system permease protein
MILLGGLGSLAGPIVGAIAYTALGEAAQLITDRKLLVEGLVILAAVILMRDGITGVRWRGDRPALTRPPRETADHDGAPRVGDPT